MQKCGRTCQPVWNRQMSSLPQYKGPLSKLQQHWHRAHKWSSKPTLRGSSLMLVSKPQLQTKTQMLLLYWVMPAMSCLWRDDMHCAHTSLNTWQCNDSVPISCQLFGVNLTTSIKEIKELDKLSRSAGPSRYQYESDCDNKNHYSRAMTTSIATVRLWQQAWLQSGYDNKTTSMATVRLWQQAWLQSGYDNKHRYSQAMTSIATSRGLGATTTKTGVLF